ncbi:MAG: leucyl aminopeptidase family protein [Ruminococcus sp.]|nr:leucyl aminopeptidase family protein [Ruminococcus sp.]
MIQIVSECTRKVSISFFREDDDNLLSLPESIRLLFDGTYLQSVWMPEGQDRLKLLVGMGKVKEDRIQRKELAASAVKQCIEKKISEFSMDIGPFLAEEASESVYDIVEGAILGTYEPGQFQDSGRQHVQLELSGVPKQVMDDITAAVREMEAVAEGICFARDMVNLPGNKLRPEDFACKVIQFIEGTGVETTVLGAEELRKLGLNALLGVGESSAYLPCMVILRYCGNPEDSKISGLIGKGVTCDTGGYCLKPGDSMLGIKGDMAGGAAVAGVVYALARNRIKTNVTAVIPMCENRISPGSLLPGDVIDSYSGKTIEIANTDAEGRLILADAVSYAVRDEGVTEVLDIATLTGAVVNMLGFSIGGAICDNNEFYKRFEAACRISGERYLRLPFYKEHEKMIESPVADIRNLGEKFCGTITAGLFIRAFAEEKPWLHLDIAGTAWVDTPVFAFQSKGATGAGVTSIYQLCSKEEQ